MISRGVMAGTNSANHNPTLIPRNHVKLNKLHYSGVPSSSPFSGGLGSPLVIVDPLLGEPIELV